MIDWKNNFGSPSRETTMREAMRLFREREGRLIVETGAFHGDPSQGCFTFHLAALAKDVGGFCITVELNPDHVAIAKEALGEAGLCSHWGIETCDSVEYLSRYQLTRPISLLVLDSYDYDPADPLPSQIHQLAELGAAYGKLASDAVVVLDDSGSKSPFAEAFLLQRGWHVAARDIAVVLSR